MTSGNARPGAIDNSSVGERVYAMLKNRILDGDLLPGSRLHQSQLSEEMGVSRTPLREAISRLAAEGMVDLLSQRGARVAEVDKADLVESYAARLIIEPAAAALAAERRDAGSLAEMESAIVQHRRFAADPEVAFEANRKFHLALVGASGNSFLVRFTETLWIGRLGRTIYTAQREPPEFIERDAAEHASIAIAVRSGDADLAQRLTYEHIAAARMLLDEALTSSKAA